MVTGHGPRDAPRLNAAGDFGADLTVDAAVDDPVAAFRDATGRGADVVVDVTAKAPAAFLQAVDLARPGGTVVVAGTRAGAAVPDFDPDHIVLKELRVLGALGVDVAAYRSALELLVSGAYPFASLLATHRGAGRRVRTARGDVGGRRCHPADPRRGGTESRRGRVQMKTRLTELLGIEHPVMLAGMGGVAYAELVAAVSDAGGFGTIGAAPLSPEQMVDEMEKVRSLTDKDFGVDLLTAFPGDMVGQVHMVIDHGASVFVAGLGVPREVVDLCHEHDVLVMNMCGKVDHAVKAVEAGCDVVIAQGTEAGGHTGRIATMPLIPLVVDAVGDKVPVVAAGGIFDGRGLAAARALGADGVWVGTRFIATPEARTVTGYKEAIAASAEDGTVISRAWTGKTLRGIRNAYTDHFEAHPEELKRFPDQMMSSFEQNALHLGGDETTPVDPDKECYAAGQAVGGIDGLVPAGELVHRFVAEAERALAEL